jgi:hypothetical protein
MLDASAFAIRTAEMRSAADGGHRVESPLIRTTHVTLLVTICQDRMRLAPYRTGQSHNRTFFGTWAWVESVLSHYASVTYHVCGHGG